jgi:hypothetical protein
MTLLADLRRHWETIRAHLARTINATHPVFAPAETSLDRASAYGQAVYTLAAARGQDPYVLATAAQHVWKARRTLYAETREAKRRVRQRTGLTAAQIARWEQAGRDASSWPDLDAVAQEVAGDFPALGLGAGFGAVDGYDRVDYAGALWDLLREADPPLRREDPALLAHAADLVDADPDGWDMARRYTFSLQRFEAYLAHHDIPWPRLPSGMLALDDDTFREMARAYPAEIGPIREVRHALSQLKLHDLAVGSDGRARCLLSAFGARTSRNQPSNSRFIFGPSCWVRSLIQPEPGHAVAYVDWSQQELGIAAALAQDPAMMAAYQSDDFYLAFAKLAGAAPADATKASHSAIREQFKVVALGVLYGLSDAGIARRLGIPCCDGRWLLRQHKALFPQFWTWSDLMEMQGMLGGTLVTALGWQLHGGANINPRSLRNFPMQGGAADMLRLACCLCTEAGIQVCAPVHDAILLTASLDTIDDVVQQAQALMREASAVILPGFPLRTEAMIVRYPDRYIDPRGAHMWAVVQQILQEALAEEVPF